MNVFTKGESKLEKGNSIQWGEDVRDFVDLMKQYDDALLEVTSGEGVPPGLLGGVVKEALNRRGVNDVRFKDLDEQLYMLCMKGLVRFDGFVYRRQR